MKLSKILTMLDELALVVVWHEDDLDDEPTYEGCAMNCPWYLAKCEIYGGLECGKSMDVRTNEKGLAVLIMTVREPK